MSAFKLPLAILGGKATGNLIRMLGAGLGSNLPGRVARYIEPAILSRISSQARQGVIAVTGTNGKSTTAGLLASILRVAGYSVVHNAQGANLITGITASALNAVNRRGFLNADFCLFETDEAALPLVAKEVKIKHIIVTNLFRDQLDRFGELDTTARLIRSGIEINQTQPILNADDPNVSQLMPAADNVFFGIGSLSQNTQEQLEKKNSIQSNRLLNMELAYCSKCGSEIAHAKVYYGQLGLWHCSQCSQKRPLPQVQAVNVETQAGGSRFDLSVCGLAVHELPDRGQSGDGQSANIFLPLPGLFNVYNALAAAAAAHALGVALETIKAGLASYTTLFGRSEKVWLGSKPAIIQLIKNPAGASQAVSAVVADGNVQILVAINDNYADGRDVSWLWDADFEQLAGLHCQVVVSGRRAEDMAIRLKYAGVPVTNINCLPNLSTALDQALRRVQAGENLWILPTYTCLLELQKILKAQGVTLSGT